MQINVKKLYEDAQLPTRGSEYAAGYDLYAYIKDAEETILVTSRQTFKTGGQTILILPHQTVKVKTGLSFELPENTFGAIFARSGLATKEGLRPANCVGVCDADYRNEYIVALHNDTDEAKVIHHGDRIAQLVLLPFIPMEFNEVSELSKTVRGGNGFGSTGR